VCVFVLGRATTMLSEILLSLGLAIALTYLALDLPRVSFSEL